MSAKPKVFFPKKFRYLCTVPCFREMECPDIGQVVLNDDTIKFITWGLNLNQEQIEEITKYYPQSSFVASMDGFYESVLPEQEATLLVELSKNFEGYYNPFEWTKL